LNHYFEQGYNLCVMGDAEELWEEFPDRVIRSNSAAFAAEKRFHETGRYMRLWGNHDEVWGDPASVQKILQPIYGEKPFNVPESILLDVKDGSDSLGKILLVHGHQGTQNTGKNTKFSRWILRNVWRPIQVLTGFSCNTPATDWRLRQDRDKIIYHWAASQPGLVLIAGHTHAPVFASYTHRARLVEEISNAFAHMKNLPEDKRIDDLNQIEKLMDDLQHLENKLSVAERQGYEPLEDPLPCYFNTGCCAFADGDITGIEIFAGEIRLVRWPDDESRPERKVLQADFLKDIFKTLKQ